MEARFFFLFTVRGGGCGERVWKHSSRELTSYMVMLLFLCRDHHHHDLCRR